LVLNILNGDKMNKKVAIITLYYRNSNYGANLQAYALCKKINELQYDACQISYDFKYTKKATLFSRVKHLVWAVLTSFDLKKLIKRIRNKKVKKLFIVREKKTNNFNSEQIPHTDRVFNRYNIEDSVEDFDVFVTGSDQVWNFKWYFPAFFLSFVPSCKTKISYAASLSMSQLSTEQKETLKNHIKDYKAVSVRENDAISLLDPIAPSTPKWVLDPTLLLEKSDWDLICGDKIIDEKYVYCHFLGNDEMSRSICADFATKHNLKIVTIPHLDYIYRSCDVDFADINLYDVGPQEFISLIKHAEYVFTDSFHAMVFSGIYKKQYFVFPRDGHSQMSSRIYSLCELYETPERFCDTEDKRTLEYIENLLDIDYERPLQKLSEMREASINYLKENLKK
jgi:hypothetical protein